jgi:hypothetical protein
MDWAVAHRVRQGGRSALAPRLVVTGVPEGTSRALLRSALVAAGYAVSLSEAGVAFANHSLLPRAHWPAAWASEGRCPELAYTKLLAYADDPHRVTLSLPAPLWASATLVARSLGLSLSGFVTGLIEAGVATYGASTASGEGGELEGGEAPRPSARPRTGRLRADLTSAREAGAVTGAETKGVPADKRTVTKPKAPGPR